MQLASNEETTVQFLSDSDPPAEGEHRHGAAGSASGCQERRAGGK